MLRNSNEIEKEPLNTPTNDDHIETELKAETPESQSTESDVNNPLSSSSEQDAIELKDATIDSDSEIDEKAEANANIYLSSSESQQDEAGNEAIIDSSDDEQAEADANNFLSSSEDEQLQQATSGFGFNFGLQDFMSSMLSKLFGKGNESKVIIVEVEVPPLSILAHLVEEVHESIHILQAQEMMMDIHQEVLKAKQAALADLQRELAIKQIELAAKQEKIAKDLNQNEEKEKSMQADLSRFYGKRMTFFCETGRPPQLVDVQAEKEKSNENDEQSSSLRASM